MHHDTPKKRKFNSTSQHSSEVENTSANNTEDNLNEDWADEFMRSYAVSPLELADFLWKYVPSSTLYQAHTDTGAFNGVGGDMSESQMYDLFITGLEKITAPIPNRHRPRFVHTSRATIERFDSPQHSTKPVIVATHPGVDAPTDNHWEWSMCACAFEIKSRASDDPITGEGECKASKHHYSTIAQLAKTGRNLLLGNLSCFVFVIGIYGSFARIFRFDRAGVIISNAFDYGSRAQILAEFFWRLVHPIKQSFSNPMPSEVPCLVGSDPTVSRPTKAEAQVMSERIHKYHREQRITADDIMKDSLWIGTQWAHPPASFPPDIMKFPPDGCAVRCLTIGKPLWQSTGLFSRATVVWKVVVENHEEELYALKDSWRERRRPPEWYFYGRIATHAREHGFPIDGMATLVGSVDLAELYAESGHRTHSAGLRLASSSTSEGTIDLALAPKQSSQDPSVDEPPHQSAPPGLSSSAPPDALSKSYLHILKVSSPHDRNHMRTLTWPVGESLSQCTSTKELMTAIFSAITGRDLLDQGGRNAVCAKVAWLTIWKSKLKITDNLPLTQLLKDFGSMFMKQLETDERAGEPVTFDAIRELFVPALAKIWPDDDHSLPCNSP
ncbi:hypothetical protein HWV62_32116 [Athelia sp. TMB]|nr:hypothetical protein HWV62_32116 [Athelia sp. TMB]